MSPTYHAGQKHELNTERATNEKNHKAKTRLTNVDHSLFFARPKIVAVGPESSVLWNRDVPKNDDVFLCKKKIDEAGCSEGGRVNGTTFVGLHA